MFAIQVLLFLCSCFSKKETGNFEKSLKIAYSHREDRLLYANSILFWESENKLKMCYYNHWSKCGKFWGKLHYILGIWKNSQIVCENCSIVYRWISDWNRNVNKFAYYILEWVQKKSARGRHSRWYLKPL